MSGSEVQAELVDYSFAGHLNANPSLPFEIRYRIDTTIAPSISSINENQWVYLPNISPLFLVEIEGHVNHIGFSHSEQDILDAGFIQIMQVWDYDPGTGQEDLFSILGDIPGSGPITGGQIMLRHAGGASSLDGIDFPTNQGELDINSFIVREFSYGNASGSGGQGTIETIQVSVVPAPNAIGLLALHLIAYRRTRKTPNASPS